MCLDPKSLQGNLLLHRTTFSLTPNTPTSTLLLPHSASPSTTHVLLLASPSGHISHLTPLAESTQRRLLSLQTQLLSLFPSVAGLNPKFYRSSSSGTGGTIGGGGAGRSVGVDTASGRSAQVVDGAVLQRWTELGSTKRVEVSGKGGYDGVGDMREELAGVLGWSGLDYF